MSCRNYSDKVNGFNIFSCSNFFNSFSNFNFLHSNPNAKKAVPNGF